MKVSFYTLGCKVNQYESNIMQQAFRNFGYDVVEFGLESDVVVIHTCAVTEESARKSRQIMRRAKRLNPESVIAVVGCLVQVDNLDLFSQADVLVGNDHKRNLPEYIGQYLQTGQRVVVVGDIGHVQNFEPSCLQEDVHTRAMVKVQDGCNNFCSYCIIPYARGRIRSKKLEDAVSEIQSLVAKGYHEIVLTGIHMDSYGKEHGQYDLCDLILAVNQVPGLTRLRLGSLEPIFISEQNLERPQQADKLCHQFHLSLQSGCDRTLKAMHRHYTSLDYETAVNRLREAFADTAVTTDIIVGFPGETDADFSECLSFAQKIQFAKIHVFPFSPRKGTRAYEMPEQVVAEVKKERCAQMLQVAHCSEQRFLQSLIGQCVEVLMEQRKDSQYVGYTANYAEVRLESKQDLRNQFVWVEVCAAEDGYCVGRLQKKEKNGII